MCMLVQQYCAEKYFIGRNEIEPCGVEQNDLLQQPRLPCNTVLTCFLSCPLRKKRVNITRWVVPVRSVIITRLTKL